MSVKGTLRAAEELLVTHGWCQGSFGLDNEPMCLVGAIGRGARVAVPGDSEEEMERRFDCRKRALDVVMGHVEGDGDSDYPGACLVSWNDADGRTVEEVLGALRGAAEAL